MAEKSQVEVLDMLLKNEAKHSDVLDIMKVQLGYLESSYPGDKKLCQGDQLTCERQMDAQHHVMDGVIILIVWNFWSLFAKTGIVLYAS